MKVALVMEMPDDMLANVSQRDERIEFRFSRPWGDRPTLQISGVWQDRWFPTMLFRVGDMLPLGEGMLIGQTGHYRPSDEELREVAERAKDDRTYNAVSTAISVRWRSLGVVEINRVIEQCLDLVRAADARASTLWRFRDGGLLQEDAP